MIRLLVGIQLLVFLPPALSVDTSATRLTQSVRFEQVLEDQRFAGSSIKCLLQDRFGWIWFGTDNGLIRYDGFGIEVWKNTADNPKVLAGDLIQCLFEDRDGMIWVGTTKGLSRYDRQTDAFVHYLPQGDTPGKLATGDIMAVAETADGSLWVADQANGLFVLAPEERRKDPGEAVFKNYRYGKNKDNLISDWVFSLFVDRTGMLWIGSLNGLMKWDAAGGIQEVDISAAIPTGKDRQILAVHEDRNGFLWLGARDEILRFDKRTGRIKRLGDRLLSLEINGLLYPSAVVEDWNGKIWISSYFNGLFAYDPKTDVLEQFLPNRIDPNGIGSQRLSSLLVDKTGLLWIGTENKGVYAHNPETSRFGHYRLETPDLTRKSPGIRAVYEEENGLLWLGTNEGVFRFDKERRLISRPGKKADLSNGGGTIRCFLLDHQGAMWAGAKEGLVRLSPKNGEPARIYRNDRGDPDSLSFDSVSYLFQDREQNLWAGTSGGGLNLYRDGKFIHFLNEGGPDGVGETINDITQDQDGVLWVATGDGLCYRRDDSFQKLKPDLQNPESLDSEQVFSLCTTRENTLWVGTHRGLNRLVRHGVEPAFERFGEKDGLPEGLMRIMESSDGFLWIGTPHGLVRFDPQKRTSRIYDARDGIQSDSFTYGVAFKNHNGRLFFAGENGFNVFNPESIRDNTIPPPVFITRLLLFNKPLDHKQPGSPLDKSIHLTESVTLSYKDNFIGFEFAALDYALPERNRYAYKMEGLHEDWRTTSGAKNHVAYANMTPGDYVFHVKGANRDGHWQEEARTLKVVIEPPLWAGKPAFVFYTLTLALLIFAFVRGQRKQLERERAVNEQLDRKVAERTRDLEARNEEILQQQHQLREMDQLKTRFFTNLSHEFRTPLTLMLGPLEDLIEQKTLPDTVLQTLTGSRRNALRMLQMINELLDVSKLEAGQMTLHTREKDITVFLATFIAQFKPLERNGPQLLTRLPDHPVHIFLDEDKLEKVVSNLIINAFKHVPAGGRIIVSLEEQDDRVSISVKDNGPGIPRDHLDHIFDRFYQLGNKGKRAIHSTGIGLSLVRELVTLHGGAIEVSSEEGFGSEFTVILLKGSNHLKPEQLPSGSDPDETAAEPASPWDTLILQETEDLPPAAAESSGDRGRTSILIIEDNHEILAYLRRNLETRFEVLTAVNGEDGLVQAREKVPDLIISDVMLPGIDGLEVCRRVKTDELTSHVPLILLTARASTDQTVAGLDSDADAYVTKPFNMRILNSLIANLIRNRRLLQQRFAKTITAAATEIEVPSDEMVFLKKAVACMEAHVGESDYGINELAEEMGFSRRQLHRKLSAITGKTPFEIFRGLRLSRAAQLLKNNTDQISQIAYSVGFSKTQHFSKLFREAYGMTPSEYAGRHRQTKATES
ncbi:MAG: two-component regulator propeller domain-containing protein [Acidobacteriota bacterium]|nr:two-component regulator propeller domain-containing protein [Acidobacteriota bacterium]